MERKYVRLARALEQLSTDLINLDKEVKQTSKCIKNLKDIVEQIAYPEKYATDYNEWFSGDGPFEAYANQLSRKAQKLLEEIDNEISEDGETKLGNS